MASRDQDIAWLRRKLLEYYLKRIRREKLRMLIRRHLELDILEEIRRELRDAWFCREILKKIVMDSLGRNADLQPSVFGYVFLRLGVK